MKKWFRKMDEMEMLINLKSLRVVYLFTIVYLVIWLICIFVSSGYDPASITHSWAFLLFTSQCVVYFASQWIMKMRINK